MNNCTIDLEWKLIIDKSHELLHATVTTHGMDLSILFVTGWVAVLV